MQEAESKITGPLQEKIMVILKNETLCGVDIMDRLRIRSPGTIYPVLDDLRSKQLVDYRVETSGPTRRKMYFLTSTGEHQIREHLSHSARTFCCDASLHMDGMLSNVKELVDIKPDYKILCTFEHDEVKKFLRGYDVTFSHDLDVPQRMYDLALCFLGVGCLIGKESADMSKYLRLLKRSLKNGGLLLAVEIEKTDNIFAKIFFEEIVGLKHFPGLEKSELKEILKKTGFDDVRVAVKSGLLYALSHNDKK